MTNTTDPSATVNENPPTLRLYFPQWQGAGVESVRTLFSEVPLEEARRGYAVGAAVLGAVLPAHSGPTALVPVESGDRGLSKQDGIEAKEAVIAQGENGNQKCHDPPMGLAPTIRVYSRRSLGGRP